MRKIVHFIIVSAFVFVAFACSNYDGDISRLDETGKAMEAKVAELKASLTSLDNTDKELKGYIGALEKKSSDLQTAIDAINEKLSKGGSEELLASLNLLRTEMENNLAKVNSSIDDLKNKDDELEGKITSLKTALTNDLKAWTQDMYDKTISDLAESVGGIKGTVETVQKSLSSLSDRIDKIEKNLDATIAAKIGEVKKGITDECSKAIQDAVSDLEAKIKGIKEYIAEVLKNYYTKDEIDLALVSILYVPTYTDGLIRVPYRLKDGKYVTEDFEVFFATSCQESLKGHLSIGKAQAYYTVDYGDDEDEGGDIANITVIDADFYPGGFSLTLRASFYDSFFAGRTGVKLGVNVILDGRMILLGYYTLVPANLDQDVKTFWVENTPFRMVKVKAGSFDMGCPSYLSGLDNAKPQHKVTLTKDYWIAETELTQKLYRTVMGDDNVTARWMEDGISGDDMPACAMSWNESEAFIERLNGLTGEEFRFPTEAEWEFAARGGIKSEDFFFSGSYDADEVAWYASNSGGRPHSVRQKKPNELGLYDMSGNCPEWCSDWYASYSAAAQTDPVGPESGEEKVVRSRESTYSADTDFISVYFRDHKSPDHEYEMHSTVRLALTVEE